MDANEWREGRIWRSDGRHSLERRARPLRAALVGPFASSEFAEVQRQVRADADVVAFDAPSHLLEWIDGNAGMELVVVAQARPGEWNGEWMDMLHRRAPLVRIVAVLGTWCEGETRTGTPLAADARIFWHQFPTWWGRQMKARHAGRAPAWSFPGGRAEIASSTGRGGLAVVAARDRESAESVALALRLGGWSSVWVRPPRPFPDVFGASAMVFDGRRLDAEELRILRTLRERYGPLPVVALCDLPTIDRAAAARADGVTVVGKPFLVEDLLGALGGRETADSGSVAARCQRAG